MGNANTAADIYVVTLARNVQTDNAQRLSTDCRQIADVDVKCAIKGDIVVGAVNGDAG